MISFLRRIRHSLLAENKFSKYAVYAIGEILLVVIGILIALQINNWNENRKLNDKRQELIAALIEDFESTEKELLVVNNESDVRLKNTETFYKLINKDTQTVTVDSLKQLARAFFNGYSFEPNLTSYKEAVSNGNISLLKNKSFLETITQFNSEFKSYENFNETGMRLYFEGSSFKLRQQFGLLNKSNRSSQFHIKQYNTYTKYLSVVREQKVLVALDNVFILNRNIDQKLKGMYKSTQEIIKILNEMKDD
ncbi:hypothetical protein JYT89_01355 [Flavobacteriaceae bacterium AH-315-B10]|nr:hypothetical protein [Flavobacteriaceae bacterium AH-315-B10]